MVNVKTAVGVSLAAAFLALCSVPALAGFTAVETPIKVGPGDQLDPHISGPFIVFTDTSSAKSITPKLIEWTVREIGAERVLYGTDSPLYFAPMQRARIDHAEFSDREKKLVLCENAMRILRLPN